MAKLIGRPPQPENQVQSPNKRTPPREVLELQLVRTWEELLGQKPIGVEQNFFEMGAFSARGACFVPTKE
jgi:hypothetical protein